MSRNLVRALLYSSFCLSLGCSAAPSDLPDLGIVTGTVTMDGQPLSGADITFEPIAGRPSSGMTDQNGKYELVYNSDYKGAVIGKSTVRISKYGEPGSPTDTVNQVPAIYGEKSKLTANVEAGDNSIDFPLKSTASQ